jgi:formiminoglutamate deiminase
MVVMCQRRHSFTSGLPRATVGVNNAGGVRMSNQVFAPSALLPDGWRQDVLITIDGTTITDVAADRPCPPAAERLPGLAIPGLANVHSHAFQRAMAGLVERRGPTADSFWSWREVMYRFLGALTPDDVEAIAAWLFAEMLAAGFTEVGEFHYLHHAVDGAAYADPAEMSARLITAAAASGIGLTLLPCFYAHGGCGGQPPVEGQRRFVTSLDRFGDLVESARCHLSAHSADRFRLAIAPHSLRAVTDGELRALAHAYPDLAMHIHAAEQEREVAECMAWSGRRPVQWLLEEFSLDARWTLIHATHMLPDETTALARSGATAGLCPITESNLGDGIFDGVRFLEADGHVAIGSDSNVRLSAAEELRTLEYTQRLRDRARNCLADPPAEEATGSTSRVLLSRALTGGARALGRAGTAGRIAPGCRADFVVLDLEHPALAGRAGDLALDSWIFTGGNDAIRSVWCAGRQFVDRGVHVAADRLRPPFVSVMRRLAAVL